MVFPPKQMFVMPGGILSSVQTVSPEPELYKGTVGPDEIKKNLP